MHKPKKKKGKIKICTGQMDSGDSYLLVLHLALSVSLKFLVYMFYILLYCGYIQIKSVIY